MSRTRLYHIRHCQCKPFLLISCGFLVFYSLRMVCVIRVLCGFRLRLHMIKHLRMLCVVYIPQRDDRDDDHPADQ